MLQLYKIVTTKDRIDAFLGVDCTSLDFATLWDFRCHLQDEFNK